VSARHARSRRCGRDLWRHPRQSEQVASAQSTSAERSEARENDVGRGATSRVASPLVMATPKREARCSNHRLARRGYSHVMPLPPASQGGSATRNDRRRRHRSLRLRCAPPSASSSFMHATASRLRALQFLAVHARASKLRSRLRALKFLAVHARASRLRALKFLAVHARASESGHLKRSFSRPPVASAQNCAQKTTRRVSLSTRGAFPCSVSCASRRLSPIPFLRWCARRIIQGPPRNLTSRRPRT
jgi:hypothetical protein